MRPWNRGLGQGGNGRQAGGSLLPRSFGPSNHAGKGAGSQLLQEPKRAECMASPNDAVRSDIQPQPRLLFPAPPPLLWAVNTRSTARACRRHWTRFASVGLIVWCWVACFIQSSPQPRDGNFPLCLHLWLQILLLPSLLPLRKSQDRDICRRFPRADPATTKTSTTTPIPG